MKLTKEEFGELFDVYTTIAYNSPNSNIKNASTRLFNMLFDSTIQPDTETTGKDLLVDCLDLKKEKAEKEKELN